MIYIMDDTPTYSATIFKNGMRTLPKQLRNLLKVQPHDKISLEKTETGILIKKFVEINS